MAIVSIEIGGQSIRAMLRKRQGKPAPVVLEDSVGRVYIPSVFARDGKGMVHVGEDAVRWKYDSEFNNIAVVEKDEQLFVQSMESVLDLIIRKAVAQSGEEVDRIVMVVPNYYSKNDPRKTYLKDVSNKLGVKSIAFIPVHEALCLCQANVDNSEHVIVLDMGHLGTNLSLLKRKDPGYTIVASKRIEGMGGFSFDEIIYGDIFEKCNPVIPDDDWCAAMAADEFERVSVYAKEKLSAEDVCCYPIPFSEKHYTVCKKEFEDMLSEKKEDKQSALLSPVYSACQELISENSTYVADVSEALLWGGSCRIPFVFNKFKLLFKQINPQMTITDCANKQSSFLLACKGALRDI